MKKPKIRFKGFTDDWEQRKLGSIAEITMGQSPSSVNYTDNPNDYILVQGNADMKNGRVFPRVWTTQITKQADKGDLILSVRAPVGDIGKTDFDVVIGRGVASIKGNEFLFQLLTKMKEEMYWVRLSTGSTFESINSNDIREAGLKVPEFEEQEQIGSLFSNLDKLITLHQRECEQLKTFKKYMLQNMFPENGEKVPKIRFKGFTDDWEQRKVSDMFKITRGNVLPVTMTAESQSDEKPYPVYSSQTKEQGLMGYYKEYLFEDAITWTTDGANAGTVNYRSGKFYCTNVCGVLLSDNNKANQMVSEALNRVSKSYVSYVGNPKLMNNVMADIEIKVPCSSIEQEKIGKYFEQLDHLITLHQRKCEQLKKFKKYMLQNMFI